MTEEKNYLEKKIEERAQHHILELENRLWKECNSNPVAYNFLVYDKDGHSQSLVEAVSCLTWDSEEEEEVSNKLLPTCVKEESNKLLNNLDNMEKFMKEHKND